MHAELSHDCPTSSVRGLWAGGYDRADGEWRRKGADAVRFGGRVLSVRELIEKAQSAPGVDWRALSSDGPLSHTARSNARECARMLLEGDSLAACWRFGILQSLDDYTSAVRRRGWTLGRWSLRASLSQLGRTRSTRHSRTTSQGVMGGLPRSG